MTGDRVPYDEFSMFHENAAEFGLPHDGPPVVRRESVDLGDGRRLSALVWGDEPPELVLLHGGAQNAHTWDTVAMALGRPLVAVDLPGHGHSDGGRNGSIDLRANAADVAATVASLAPGAAAVVGMSLGGITTLALAADHPDLVRSVVLVDVTPGVNSEKASAITAFVNGPESFDSFDDLLARTIEFNPTRSESSLRRGILHNALQRDDGSWVWRYARFRDSEVPTDRTEQFPDLWSTVSGLTVPLMLVRGMRPQSVVDDADEAELLRRRPDARVEHLAEAGHSVQGDTPLELAALLDDFVSPAGLTMDAADDETRPFDRRAFLGAGGAALGLFLAGCSGGSGDDGPDGDPGDAKPAGTASTTSAADGPATTGSSGDDLTEGTPATTVLAAADFAALGTCQLSTPMTAGPFPSKALIERRDVTEGIEGHPVRLGLQVVDEACSPVPGAVVELWHCDTTGDYSAYLDGGTDDDAGDGTTFLRGSQVANDDGVVEFHTVYPGWYSGRAVHIHLGVHVGDTEALVTQLFFADELNEQVFASGPYAAHGEPDTTNEQDGISTGDPDAIGALAITSDDADIGGTRALLRLAIPDDASTA